MTLDNEDYMQLVNTDDFLQDRLVSGKQKVFVNNTETVTLDSFQLPGYDSFSFRQHGNEWVLSIRGKLLTFGSYEHLIDVIMLLIQVFKCWHSETSLIHFLNCKEYTEVINEILTLRKLDHEAN